MERRYAIAKRFTDSDKWNDEWFLSLSNDYRMVWQWLLDNCNYAGICKRNMKLLNFMCNTLITENDLLESMDGRIVIVENTWFIPKFIKFQYSTLQSNKPVILAVVKELKNHNDYITITERLGNDYLIIKDKDKDKVKEKEKRKVKEKEKGSSEEDNYYLSYVDFDFLKIFENWIEYKKDRKESYKSNKSLEACYKNLIELSGNDKKIAEQIINQSMGNNWAGLFPLKNQTNQKKETQTAGKYNGYDSKFEYLNSLGNYKEDEQLN